jgi:hypothetical protein
MNTNLQTSGTNNWIVIGLGILAAVIIFLALTGRPIPLISGDRAAFLVLVVIGLAMCTVGGIGPAVSNYGWAHPLTIAGSVFGVLILLLSAKVLAGVSMPVIVTDRDAIVALTVLCIIKIIINLVYPILFTR